MTATLTWETPAGPDGAASEDAPRGVSGADILDEARAFLSRFVSFGSPSAAVLAALWAMHTHCVSDGKLLFDSTPRLAFLSDEPGSGKSRALEVTGSLCRKPMLAADVTGPALTTLITEGATILVDELDLVLGGSGNTERPVRAVINSGYRRSGAVARAKGMQSTFAPVALAGLASVFTRNPLLAPTRTRAVAVIMRKAGPGADLDFWRERLHRPQANAIADAMSSWALAQTVALVTTYPDLPEGCVDRLADLWEPLLTIADVADPGGEWPARARGAFAELGRGDAASEPVVPPGLRLIADIREVWPEDQPRLSTADLVSMILGVEGSAWAPAWKDAAAIPRELAALLQPYGIGPRKLRVTPGASPVQGYLRSDFDVPAVGSVPDVPES